MFKKKPILILMWTFGAKYKLEIWIRKWSYYCMNIAGKVWKRAWKRENDIHFMIIHCIDNTDNWLIYIYIGVCIDNYWYTDIYTHTLIIIDIYW